MASRRPVLSCKEAVALERQVLGGDPAAEWRAMRRAGAALGHEVEKDFWEVAHWPRHARLLVLAGKGNNAGDAFLAAAGILCRHPDASAEIALLMGERSLGELARRAWGELLAQAAGRVTFFSLRKEGDISGALEERLGRQCFHLSLDGIFGMNFRQPFRPPMDRVVEWLNDYRGVALRAAVDVPSGLSDETAGAALRADFTYFTGSAKQPALTPENARWSGRVRYLDIGFFDDPPAELADRPVGVRLPGSLAFLNTLRDPLNHKKKHGHLLAIGGSRTMPGAILMSLLAAVRSGAGLVTALVPESLTPAFAARLPEAMWLGCAETDEGGLGLDGLHLLERALPKADAVLAGPGVGTAPDTQAFLEEVCRKVSVPMVIDAEALQPKVVQILAGRGEMRGKVLLTPHAGEFQRISGKSFAESGEAGLLAFCRETGLAVLLKGPPVTRICDPDGRIDLVLPGGPVLARGGSGDLLAGLAGGLAAGNPGDSAFAGSAASLWHGLAAERLARHQGQHAVRTTDLLDHLASVSREMAGHP